MRSIIRFILAISMGGALGAPQIAAAAESAPPARIKRTEVIAAENWTITCVTLDQRDAKRKCSADLKIFQTAKDSNARTVVFSWAMTGQEGKAVSVLAVPTGVQIAPGVVFKLKDHEPKRLPFSICAPDHCEAPINIDRPMVKALSNAKTAEFSVTGSNGAVANFTVNLEGFAEAWEAIVK